MLLIVMPGLVIPATSLIHVFQRPDYTEVLYLGNGSVEAAVLEGRVDTIHFFDTADDDELIIPTVAVAVDGLPVGSGN